MLTPPPLIRSRIDVGDRMRVIAVALALLGGVLAIRSLVAMRSVSPIDPPLRGVDPNTASWSDLALLPEIGEQTARAIIAYREQRDGCVFHRAEDLLDVKGIGPKTLEAITPHLRFDSCSEP